MSPELANAMAPFCTSLLHGKDMIPRLGVGPTERLRDQMVSTSIDTLPIFAHNLTVSTLGT